MWNWVVEELGNSPKAAENQLEVKFSYFQELVGYRCLFLNFLILFKS